MKKYYGLEVFEKTYSHVRQTLGYITNIGYFIALTYSHVPNQNGNVSWIFRVEYQMKAKQQLTAMSCIWSAGS